MVDLREEIRARPYVLRAVSAYLWVVTAVIAVYGMSVHFANGFQLLGADGHAYWVAASADVPYQVEPGELDAFLYSPVFLQPLRLLAWVPWPVFLAGLMVADAMALWWLTRPLAWRWRGPVLLGLGVPAMLIMNITPLLCVCFVLGVTRRQAWTAVPLVLTKVTPTAAMVLWWAGRGQWHLVAKATLMTLALTAVSFAIDPGLWSAWFSFLVENRNAGPEGESVARYVKATLGVVLAVWAARSGRAWLLGVAFYLLNPVGLDDMYAHLPLITIPWLLAYEKAEKQTVAPLGDSMAAR